MKFEFEKEFLEKHEDGTDTCNLRKTASDEEINKLREQYPRVSKDFLDYLEEIGYGAFRECQFKVEKYLYELDDLGLAEQYEVPSGIKFFGDNFSGDFSGFDFNNDSNFVIELWHEDGTIFKTNKTFKEYIRQQMLIDENGADTRIK
jgi:hypothetical protein